MIVLLSHHPRYRKIRWSKGILMTGFYLIEKHYWTGSTGSFRIVFSIAHQFLTEINEDQYVKRVFLTQPLAEENLFYLNQQIQHYHPVNPA